MPSPLNTPYLNDQSTAAPRLASFLHWENIADLPAWSQGPSGKENHMVQTVKDAGFEGIQGGPADLVNAAGLKHAAGGRVNAVGEIDELCREWVDQGAIASTLHVGWGLEDDATMDALVDDILQASDKHKLPLYIETHRSTITQDNYRTVQLAKRHPGLKFNGDFSHWYTGLEMTYATVDTVVDFSQPVLEHIGFMHGRMGNSGCIQVDIGPTAQEAKSRVHVQHFLQIWGAIFKHFKKNAAPGDYLPFTPELLSPTFNYARTFPDSDGQLREEGDRWLQALLYAKLASEAFELA